MSESTPIRERLLTIVESLLANDRHRLINVEIDHYRQHDADGKAEMCTTATLKFGPDDET